MESDGEDQQQYTAPAARLRGGELEAALGCRTGQAVVLLCLRGLSSVGRSQQEPNELRPAGMCQMAHGGLQAVCSRGGIIDSRSRLGREIPLPQQNQLQLGATHR